MTLTLFGGMLLIAALFFALGFARVPTFWRGIVSGLLPVLGMIVHSMQRWPGGDVMALHLALYLATATVLTLAFGRQREEKQRLHWAPVVMVIFFVGLSGLMAFFLSIASHGLPPALAKQLLPKSGDRPVYTAFSGEVPHDEEAAKTISHYLKQAHQQKELGWRLTVDGLDGMRREEGRPVTVTVTDAGNRPLDGATVQIALARPGARQAEKQWLLSAAGPGRYRAELAMAEGQWLALLSVIRGQDKFETAKEILVQAQ